MAYSNFCNPLDTILPTSSISLVSLTDVSTQPTSIHPSSSPDSPATNLITSILDKFHSSFSGSPEVLERCALPLNQLLEYTRTNDVCIVDPGNAVEDGLLLGPQFTLRNILEDLERTRYDGLKRNCDLDLKIHDAFRVLDTLTVEDLRVTLIHGSMGPNKDDKRTPFILAALDVPSHPAGSGKIHVTTPHYLSHSGSVSFVPGGYPDKTAVVSTTGFITEPHWDYYGVPQIIMHASGEKLWLIWPPTEHNIQIASDALLTGARSMDLSIGGALELLQGLEIRLCREQNDYFTLPPYAIHAVISVTSCSHKNKLYTEFGHFPTWDRSFSYLFTKLTTTYNRGGMNALTKEDVYFELTEGNKAFLHWEVLVSEFPAHPEVAKVRARLDELRGDMKMHLKKFAPPTMTHAAKKARIQK
jgi:hypothetical protein